MGKLFASCGEGREGSDWGDLDLSAFAREGAWGPGLQTEGQRKNGAVWRPRPSVRGKFVSFKVSGTKSLENAGSCKRREKWAPVCVAKNCGTFRIERGC